MQFSNLALAAFITAGVEAACPPKGFHAQKPSGVPGYSAWPSAASAWPSAGFSIPSYSFSGFAVPTTLSSVVVPATTAVVETSSAAPTTALAIATTSSVATTTSSAAAATSSAASTDSSLTTDQSNALASHNSARADVGEDALVWDTGLVSDAQVWADHLASLGAGSLTHDDQSTEGENLYWSSDSTNPYEAAAAAWIAEKSSYNGEAITGTGNFENYGHYTQIIWKTTTNVGMAIADDGSGGVYVVARYSPPGNVMGETPTNAS